MLCFSRIFIGRCTRLAAGPRQREIKRFDGGFVRGRFGFSSETFANRLAFVQEGVLAIVQPEGQARAFNYELNVYGYQLKEFESQKNTKISIKVQIKPNATLRDIKTSIQEQMQVAELEFLCEDSHRLSLTTPIEALINRYFRIKTEVCDIVIRGQQLCEERQPGGERNSRKIIQSLKGLQLPVLTRREIERYVERIEVWLEAKYGVDLDDARVGIPSQKIKEILIEALIDPAGDEFQLAKDYAMWEQMYWRVIELRKKKVLAEVESARMAKNAMSVGLGVIAANIGFIWSGTYIFYSWDIMEPVAYFLSSFWGILLIAQFRKLQKPYSNENMKQFIARRYMPKACGKVGLDLEELERVELQLAEMESQWKDSILMKL